ncbi:MAG: hypothetical protein J7M25_13730 [Deltaproteobacteria bacterium]|nr:hypothetical protein [Deltaproteobacteria bacterium]
MTARVLSHARRLILKLDHSSALANDLPVIRARLKKLTVVGALLAKPPNDLRA